MKRGSLSVMSSCCVLIFFFLWEDAFLRSPPPTTRSCCRLGNGWLWSVPGPPSGSPAQASRWTPDRGSQWWARSCTCWQSSGRCPWPRCTRWRAWPGNPPGRSLETPGIDRHLQRRLPYAAEISGRVSWVFALAGSLLQTSDNTSRNSLIKLSLKFGLIVKLEFSTCPNAHENRENTIVHWNVSSFSTQGGNMSIFSMLIFS